MKIKHLIEQRFMSLESNTFRVGETIFKLTYSPDYIELNIQCASKSEPPLDYTDFVLTEEDLDHFIDQLKKFKETINKDLK